MGIQEVFVLAREIAGPCGAETEAGFLRGRFQVHSSSGGIDRFSGSGCGFAELPGREPREAEFLAHRLENPCIGPKSKPVGAATVRRRKRSELASRLTTRHRGRTASGWGRTELHRCCGGAPSAFQPRASSNSVASFAINPAPLQPDDGDSPARQAAQPSVAEFHPSRFSPDAAQAKCVRL
jgi:hypothetical protein